MLRGKPKPKPDHDHDHDHDHSSASAAAVTGHGTSTTGTSTSTTSADRIRIRESQPTASASATPTAARDLARLSAASASSAHSSRKSTPAASSFSFNTAAAHFLDRLNAVSSDANASSTLHKHLAAVLPRQLLHHIPIPGPYQHLAASPPLPPTPNTPTNTAADFSLPVLPPLDLPPPLPERVTSSASPPPPPLPPRNRCTSPLPVSTFSACSDQDPEEPQQLDDTMYRPSPSTSSHSAGAPAGSDHAGGSGFAHLHQQPVGFMPAIMGQTYGHAHGHQQQHTGHAPGSVPMPQPMPMPGGGGMVHGASAGIYPPPSPSPSVASGQYPVQHQHSHAHQHHFAQQQQQQPGAPNSVTSSLASLNNQSSPSPAAPSFTPPTRYFATNSSAKSTASMSSSHSPAAPHVPPMSAAAAGGHYQGRNSPFFHDPTVPIPAIPDTLKKQRPQNTTSASSIHSGVSSAHTLITDPSNLPRQVLDIDRRVMLFVSASGTNPMSLGAFPHDIEDVMFASSPTPYDMEILPEYDTSSLDAAAKRLLLYIKLMSFDTKRTMRVMLVGIDVGGIVALEAVRMFLGAVAAQTPQYGARGAAADPKDRETNWLLRVVFDGVLCVNAPVFLLHPQVFGNVDRSAFGKYAGLFAFPPEAVQSHGTGSSSSDASGSGRKKDRGGVFGFGKLAKVVGGMAGTPSSSPTSPGTPPASVQIPFDASWTARFDLMAPLLRSQEDRVNRITQLLQAKVPLALLVTQTSNPQAVTSPTFVHIPGDLPEYMSRLVVRFTAPPTSPVSSYQLIAEALDKSRQPGMYAQMIQYITRVAGHWASVAR